MWHLGHTIAFFPIQDNINFSFISDFETMIDFIPSLSQQQWGVVFYFHFSFCHRAHLWRYKIVTTIKNDKYLSTEHLPPR